MIKPVLPILITFLMFACDESGEVKYEHLGKWMKDGDSIIYPDERIFRPSKDYTSDVSSIEFYENFTYESLTLNSSGDTTYQYLGKWSLSLDALTLYYEVGPLQVYTLRVQEDMLNLIYEGYYYRLVEVYHKVE